MITTSEIDLRSNNNNNNNNNNKIPLNSPTCYKTCCLQ